MNNELMEAMQSFIPPKVLELNAQLYDLCNTKEAISIDAAASLTGLNPKTLRHSIYKGTCPFGIGYEGERYSQGFGKVVTLPFYNFMTQGVLYKFLALKDRF